MKHFFALTGIVIIALCHLGCSSDDERAQFENPTEVNTAEWFGAPLGDDVVLENMYETEAKRLADKTRVQIVTVLEGTGRVTIEARFRGVRSFGYGFPLYECELMDEAVEAMGGIAQGMSGSPVGPPGRVMGALAYADKFSASPRRFWVTAIDAMEAARDHQAFGDLLLEADPAPAAPTNAINAVYNPVKTPLLITGIQPHRLSQLAAQLNGQDFRFIELIADVAEPVNAPPANKTKLAAGDMIGVAFATGDVVNAMGLGTVTQVYDDGTFVAFGHPLGENGGGGKLTLPVYRAVVNGIVPNLSLPYKSGSVYGNPIGTLTKDFTAAVVGELGAPPPMIPVKVTYQVADGPVTVKHHKVAHGQERFIALVAATTMDAIRKEISPGTLDATVEIHFKETKTVYTESFRVASSGLFLETYGYVTDVVTSFTDIFANPTARATLDSVSIALKDNPRIKEAIIQEVITPEEIVPGESATFTVVLLPHWSATTDGRKIHREVTLDIPENFPVGEAILSVVANRDLIAPFFFGNGSYDEEKFPENLDEVIKRKLEGQINVSAITITLGPPQDTDFNFSEDFPIDFNINIPGLEEEIVEAEETDDITAEETDDILADEETDEIPEEIDLTPIETEIVIEGFIVSGSKELTVIINGEDEILEGTDDLSEDFEEDVPSEEEAE